MTAGPDGIAIVGLAGLFPGAADVGAYWANIRAGVDATSEVPAGRWDPVFFDPEATGADRFYCNRGGFVDALASFDPLAFGIMPVAMESAEPDQLLALTAAAAALADAGDPLARLDPTKVAVILGRGGYVGDGVARLDQRVRTAQQLVEALRVLVPGIDEGRLDQVRHEFQERLGPERPEGSIGLVPNLAASRIANRFDLRGPAYTVDAACASSLIAVDQGAELLRSGRADLVLAGGVHHCHDLTLWSVFSQLRALSPTGAIRPFSEAADGILVGEGTGILALKRQSDAERDGDRIYAVIRGSGVASDGSGASLMSPAPAGQIQAVEQAWRAAGLDPRTVGLIEAHGTATPVGDRVELETLRKVFGSAEGGRPRAGLGSVKSMIGHAMPAAGAAGLIKTALAVFHGELPPTLHVDQPNEALADSRFRLITEVEPWESDGPRRAGVNAFGFGGINAHVVVEEHPSSRAGRRAPRPSAADAVAGDVPADAVAAGAARPAELEEVVLLAGADAGDLLAQLDAWEPRGDGTVVVPSGGPARLAIVAPDARRLQLARKVLERGTPFRGRNDVWFDPTGLAGADGGKVAFLFPGVEPVFDPKVDDVAEQLGLDWEGLAVGTSPLEAQSRGIAAVGRLLARALGRLGIEPDAMAGHSLGEWTGQVVSGMVPESYVEEFLHGLGPSAIEVSDVVFVALGAGADVAAELVADLPDAYVSHDNCPHQSVICAPAAVMATAVARAKERKVLAQELPFRSGFHSPLFQPYVAGLAAQFGTVPLVAATVPMWSATTTEPYPDDPDAIIELAGRHLVEPVRFRELVDRLYADGVRAFVQVGTGSLMGFVDDTLRDRDVLSVSANTAKHTGVGQLRRVAAALWSAGRSVDFAPLGHVDPTRPAGSSGGGSATKSPSSPVPLVLGSSLVRDLTPLELARPSLDGVEEPAVPGSLLAEFRSSVAEATAAVHDVLNAAATTSRTLDPTTTSRPSANVKSPRAERDAPGHHVQEGSGAEAAKAEAPPTTHETVHALSVTAQPHWRDHSFYEQPAGWPCIEDEFPLVPMTAIIEMLADEAQHLAPGHVVVAVEQIRAFKWLAVEPPVAVTVKAALDRTDDDGTTVVRASIERHARAQVRLAPAYALPPKPSARPVHGDLPLPVATERLYDERHLFHGPQYQGIESIRFGTDGAVARLVTKPAPGQLLDNAGQTFGYWFASLVDRDRLVLPTSIDRISFYGPHPEPGTRVDCVANLTDMSDQMIRVDLELTVDGTVWCTIEGWEDRRFQSDDRLFHVLRQPQRRLLGETQPGGWVLVREGWPDSASRDVVMRRYLGRAERTDYEGRNPNVQRTWLLGRIAVKDAVRDLLWRQGAGPLFPVEVHVANDPLGQPRVEVPGDDDVRVSISHVGTLGVALAGVGDDVGIDVERVEHRPSSFLFSAFTPAELDLIAARHAEGDDAGRDAEVTRWWAAKEAAAKAAGSGMEGRPKDWEVVEADGHRLRIGRRWIATARLAGTADGPLDHVVAWTEVPPRADGPEGPRTDP